MREKPPGVLAPEEEANSNSPKAFLPANLLPVPDCCHIGVPTAGKFTSSVWPLLLFYHEANERRTISRGNSETEGTADRNVSKKQLITFMRRSTVLKLPWTLEGAAWTAECRVTGDNADSFIFLGFILKQAASKHVNYNLRWRGKNQEARRLGYVTKGGAGGHRKSSGCTIRASS